MVVSVEGGGGGGTTITCNLNETFINGTCMYVAPYVVSIPIEISWLTRLRSDLTGLVLMVTLSSQTFQFFIWQFVIYGWMFITAFLLALSAIFEMTKKRIGAILCFLTALTLFFTFAI